ncbi:uncharacterized protein ARMOST_17706 [Armillaria ostoyae]|uniref:Uncharacterized protein n=1 Tax=Armillaria ostoyae TaxID=47428 RepID=A0A284RZS9_ARMOS|nr:uncharacterized protein ARMOST_17706 [Armillaria ostoyae]
MLLQARCRGGVVHIVSRDSGWVQMGFAYVFCHLSKDQKDTEDQCLVLLMYLEEYNNLRLEFRSRISLEGGQQQSGGHLWWKGALLPDGHFEEFDEDCAFLIQYHSRDSSCDPIDAMFTYNFKDIDTISQDLGIPWKLKKDIPFSSSFPFTGLLWNLQTRSISLSPEKREKYIATIHDWLATNVHILSDIQSLYRKLLHTTRVIPMGRAYLTNLEKFLTIAYDRPFLP